MAKPSKTKNAPIVARARPKSRSGMGDPWYTADWLRALLLFVFIATVYQPVWHAGFVWDDDDHITANPTVIGPQGLKEIWTTGAGDIAPLTRSTFWLEYKLFGLNPLPYHLLNILLQAACAILFWQILRKLRVPGAWLAAALWTLHPLQVESIAWISEMKNTESGLFFLLSVFFFIEEIRNRNKPTQTRWRYGLTLLFAALAMVAKASTMILPASLCLCAWWLQRRWDWRNLVKMIPVAIMSVLASAMAIWATGRRQEISHDHPIVATLPERIIGAADALWFYLGKLVWPRPLMALYPVPHIDAAQWFSWLPVVVIIALLAALWPGRRAWTLPYFLVLAWFITALLPALGLVDPYTHRYSAGYSLFYDHFQYLASMAPLALLAAGTALLSLRYRYLAAAFLLLLLGATSWQRVWAFQSNESLWTDAVAGNPQCWSCHYSLGAAELAGGKAEEALPEFQKTVELNPRFAEARNNLGISLSQKGQVDAAIDQFRKAAELKPEFAEAHYNLGSALASEGRPDEAAAEFRTAFTLNPDYAEAHNNLGLALAQKGMVDAALAQFQRALEIRPGFAEAQFNLGHTLLRNGRPQEGIAHLQESLRINPEMAEPHDDLGIAFAQKRQFDQARAEFQAALRLNPADQSARDNLIRVETAEAQLAASQHPSR